MLELGETEHQIALRKQAEFRALQSQINPHFLFNALNTISALCMTDPDRACKTILILANYFRQTLTINEPFVPLEQEISNVDNYLMLTEARFEGALHVECELPDDLRALRLPPLILQPSWKTPCGTALSPWTTGAWPSASARTISAPISA